MMEWCEMTDKSAEACRAAFYEHFKKCGKSDSEIQFHFEGLSWPRWQAAWVACKEYHDFRIYNIEHRREFLQKRVNELEAKAQGLVEALKYIVDHKWAAEKPKWGNEFVGVARQALQKFEQTDFETSWNKADKDAFARAAVLPK